MTVVRTSDAKIDIIACHILCKKKSTAVYDINLIYNKQLIIYLIN